MADLTQTASSVVAGSGAKKITGVAGGTITAGLAVYLDTADGKYKALFAGSEETEPAGIALTNSSNGQPVVIQYEGEINLGATLVFGELYCASAAVAGNIAPVADLIASNGNYIHVLGMARNASTLVMNLFSLGVAYNEE